MWKTITGIKSKNQWQTSISPITWKNHFDKVLVGGEVMDFRESINEMRQPTHNPLFNS